MVFTFSSLCATGKVLPACEKCIGKLSPGCLFEAWPCLPQPNGAEFQVLSYLFVPLSRYFVHEWWVLSWVSRYKDNKLLSICRNIISQDDFIARTNVWMDSYRNMPNRFDTTLSSWKTWVTVYLTLIFLQEDMDGEKSKLLQCLFVGSYKE